MYGIMVLLGEEEKTINMEDKELAFSKMMDLIGETRKGDEGNYGVITLDGLEELTQKGLEEEFVIDDNKQLTKAYKHVVVSYGFEDFHSLYLFALSNTQNEIMKYDSGAPKDYSSMNKVRRTVVRNGRRTAMSFYESPKGLDNKQKVRVNRGGDKAEDQVAQVTELKIIAQGDLDEPIPIKELQAINNMMDGFIAVGEFEDIDRIKLYLDEYMIPKAVQGLTVEGEYLTMPFRATDGNVHGFYQRAFFELIKVALNWELGIKVEEDGTKIQKILVETSELREVDDYFIATYEELLEIYGEMP